MRVRPKKDDRVRLVNEQFADDAEEGDLGTVLADDGTEYYPIRVKWDDYPSTDIHQVEDLEVLSPKQGTGADMVNHPPHYTRGGIEVIDFLSAYFGSDPLGWQVVKYLSRAGHKWDALEDVKKAKFYLDRKVQEMEAALDPDES